MAESMLAKMAAAPGQKLSSWACSRLATPTRSATRSSRLRTRARSALTSSEAGRRAPKRCPSVRSTSEMM